jgi:hypothetical protein
MTDHVIEMHEGCLLCAVRALTEGQPEAWQPTTLGDQVQGVVLKTGTQPSDFGRDGSVRFVDLYSGVSSRIRVWAYSSVLAREIERAEVQVGDVLTVTYAGLGIAPTGRFAGREYKKFTVSVTRGHH